jgi:thioredoxin-related protein
MRIPTLLLAVAMGLTAITTSTAQETKQRWFSDFDKAMTVAQDEGKDLFVDFTGSDWCHWCTVLDEEVFSHDEFYNAVAKQYVLVALDFPNGEEAKMNVPNPARNQELMATYAVDGFPTILLVNRKGNVFGRTGYMEGGPAKYIVHLNELSAAGKKAIKVAAKIKEEYAQATAETKPAVIKRAAAILSDSTPDTPGIAELGAIVRDGVKLDPENKSGLKLLSLKALLRSGTANSTERFAGQKMDPKNELGVFELVVASRMGDVMDEQSARAFVRSVLAFKEMGQVHDAEVLQGIAVQCAYWCMMLEMREDAEVLAKWTKDMGEIPERLTEMYTELAKVLAEPVVESGHEGHDHADGEGHEHGEGDGHEHDGR